MQSVAARMGVVSNLTYISLYMVRGLRLLCKYARAENDEMTHMVVFLLASRVSRWPLFCVLGGWGGEGAVNASAGIWQVSF